MAITWEEFKAKVEEEIKLLGIDSKTAIIESVDITKHDQIEFMKVETVDEENKYFSVGV